MTPTSATVGLSIGKRRALQSASTAEQIFAILAVDHIGALAEVARPADPTSVSTAELVELKVRLVELLSPATSGVLLDPVLALDPIVGRDVLPGGIGMLVALEDGDYASIDRAPRLFADWSVKRAAASGATAIKCSFLYDPFDPSPESHSFVSDLVEGCAEHELPLFAEPLGMHKPGEERRTVVVETAKRIGALGVDVLKLEFPGDPGATESEWGAACAELTDACPVPWTLLSAGEDFETYVKQLDVACRNGASGYVAGRAVWQDLVAAGVPTAGPELDEARRRIAVLSDVASQNAKPWSDWFAEVQA